jgi:hypothetical protein
MERVLINHGNGWAAFNSISFFLFNVADPGKSLLQVFTIHVNGYVLIGLCVR